MASVLALPGAPSPGAQRANGLPRVRRAGLGYVWERPDLALCLRIDYLRERSDEFTGELVVETTGAGSRHLHQARLNLSSTRTRKDLAAHLAALTPGEALPWPALIEQFCVAVLTLERRGEPLVRVGHDDAPASTPDVIERLLPAAKPTLWYGAQGIGKGWLTVAACVCHATGARFAGLRVQRGIPLYLDWEDSAETLNLRVQAVSSGLDLPGSPEIAYRTCRRTLARDLHAIMRHVSEVGATLVIVDSVGLAAGAAGEHRSYEDVALGLFEALRELAPATVLLIDHLAGAETKREGGVTGKSFGSIYKMAEARAAWEIRADQEPGAEEVLLALHHTKHNHTQHYPTLGLRLAFAPTDPGEPPAWVRLERGDVGQSELLSRGLPLAEQLAGALRHGALHVRDLAAGLDLDASKVRVALNRGLATRFIKLPDGRWALVARHSPEGPLPFATRQPDEDEEDDS